MDLEREYPALTDLMMSGFHLDFWDFHESPEVVSTFTRDPIFCARIPLEVESLLGEFAGPDREERLDEILWKLTNNYDYDEEGITASAWLIAVRDQVVAETPSVEMIDALVGARVLGATGGEVLTAQTDVAFDTRKQLHLATRSLELVGDRQGLRPHWTFTRVTS